MNKRSIFSAMVSMAILASHFAHATEPPPRTVVYQIKVTREFSEDKRRTVSDMTLVAREGRENSIYLNEDWSYLLACNDAAGKTISCGDEYEGRRQLGIILTPEIQGDGVETKVAIYAAEGNGRQGPFQSTHLVSGTLKTSPGRAATVLAEDVQSTDGLGSPIPSRKVTYSVAFESKVFAGL